MALATEDSCPQEVDEAAAAGPFEDEETRAFYESLPDLRAVVPAVLLGDKPADEASNGFATDSAADLHLEAPQADNDSHEAIPAGELNSHLCIKPSQRCSCLP